MTTTMTKHTDRERLVEARTLNVALMEKNRELEIKLAQAQATARRHLSVRLAVRRLASAPAGSEQAMAELDRAFAAAGVE